MSVSADSSPVTFEIVHTSRYAYSEKVLVSHHLARLSPRAFPYQECVSHALEIVPQPSAQAAHTDYFGNAATFFAMQGAHTGMSVTGRSTVTVTPRALPPFGDAASWETAGDQTTLPLDALDALVGPVPAHMRRQCDEYARPSFPPGCPLMEGVADLTARIFNDFTFDPTATTVATPLDEVFQLRRGVCQDFARFEIACLRAMGVPALYVSGYLETTPPPGKPRRIGADASHAWLAVHCPGHGWIDVDPTNNMFPSNGHVTLARGLDYGDVSPIRGVILGGGQHSLQVSVDVLRTSGPTTQ
jgi:transglutaminase-like putative cysteine protease